MGNEPKCPRIRRKYHISIIFTIFCNFFIAYHAIYELFISPITTNLHPMPIYVVAMLLVQAWRPRMLVRTEINKKDPLQIASPDADGEALLNSLC